MALSKAKKPGITLSELIVAMALLTVILALCTNLFVSSFHRLQMTNAMQDAQNNAIVGLDRFTRDFRETTKQSVVYYKDSSHQYIYFPSPRDRNGVFHQAPNGFIEWSTWIAYYMIRDPNFASQGQQGEPTYLLARRQQDILDKKLTNTPAFDWNSINGAEIAAKNAVQFNITSVQLSEYMVTYEVSLHTKREYKGKAYTYQAERFISIRDRLQPIYLDY
ncbi:MAG: prepilin-type N-terminal cleavage/methylation domain-containing protein [Candidatus Eremiobacteraeota bacterium]|nr:prepilin-type N-terminal cleavage/methylation domain-containing protein [Candidatus Eremiobacteraeota bacterium]